MSQKPKRIRRFSDVESKNPEPMVVEPNGHLQRCQMPDIENSRKTAEKGAEWVPVS